MWRPGEAARRREEERARRAEEARIAGERHEQSLGETRRQTSLTKVGVWVGIVGLVAAVVVPLFRRDDPPPPATGSGPVVVAEVNLWRAADFTWVVPKARDELGAPPAFVRDADGIENHCEEWTGWFAANGAAHFGGAFTVEASASLAAPVTIVDFDVTVLRKVRTPATTVRCSVGGGGVQSAYGEVSLDAARPVVTVTDGTDREFRVTRGEDTFVVAPGATESIFVKPAGTAGFLYEWTITLTYIQDARTRTEVLGSATDPLRHYAYADPSRVPIHDWDAGRKVWVVV